MESHEETFSFWSYNVGVFLDGSQVLTTCRCGLSSMASGNYFQYQSMTYNKLCVNKVSCFMEVYLCEQNELLYDGGLYVWTKWVAFWNLNLSPKSWVLALGVLELMRHDGFADLVRYPSDVVLSLAFITGYYFLLPHSWNHASLLIFSSESSPPPKPFQVMQNCRQVITDSMIRILSYTDSMDNQVAVANSFPLYPCKLLWVKIESQNLEFLYSFIYQP